ncbi:MAG: caspase family protein, partial [SAR324 cluster bacterium]|nr:caspase family protein [SAR324 cluster bacterium]
MRHIHCKLLLALAILLFTLPAFAAETRGVKRVEIKTKVGESVGLYEESHALVIGVSDYTNGWPKLPGVRKDVKAVTAALESHGFNVEVVEDAEDYMALDQAFTGFIRRHGRKPENRLLFYFAGHGHTVKNYGEEMGYIIPTSSPNPNRDLDGFLDSAMDMRQIEVYAQRIRSKHALFLFDSCFSGSLFALSRAVPENISYKTTKPVRQFITSGSADETVPDTSTFRQQFVAALGGEGDTDGDRYVTAIELGEFLQKTVVNYSRNAQHPQYGKIRNPNLDKGDFVFALPKAAPEPESTAAAPAPATVAALAPSQFLPDEEMWKELQDSDSPEDFEDFLVAFPESKLAPVARMKLKRLKRQQSKAKAEQQQITEAKRKTAEEQKKQLAEEAKQEEERKRQEAEQRQIAEAKRKPKISLLSSTYLQQIPDDLKQYFQNFVIYEDHTYAITRRSMRWPEVRNIAHQNGGHLATINDAKENKFLADYFSHTTISVYIGYNDAKSEGSWTWTHGDSTFTNWVRGEPNNYKGREDYAMLYLRDDPTSAHDGYTQGKWNDVPDGNAHALIEWEQSIVNKPSNLIFSDNFENAYFSKNWNSGGCEEANTLNIVNQRLQSTSNSCYVNLRRKINGDVRIEFDVEKDGYENHGCHDYQVYWGNDYRVVLLFNKNGQDMLGIGKNAFCSKMDKYATFKAGMQKKKKGKLIISLSKKSIKAQF